MREIGKLIWSKMGNASGWVQPVGTLIVGLLVGVAPLILEKFIGFAIVGAIAVTAAMVVLAIAKESRVEKLERALGELKADHSQCSSRSINAARKAAEGKDAEYVDYIELLCKDRLALLLHQVTKCFSSTHANERQRRISTARTAIVHATVDLIGNSDTGTRANIFRLIEDDNGERMEPEAFWGRGDESTRVFRPGMTTFDEAKKGKSRFVSRTDPDEDDEKLTYDTYLTYPIKEGTGKLYGLLTVDCVNAGELTEVPDRGKMSVLAAMLALTYRAEGLRITAVAT